MEELLRKTSELTPIQEYHGILYKRDDLFRPFPGEALNGGKLRQAINLIYHDLDLIRSDYKSKVATTCNINSPQGLIIARVANYFGLGCFVGYGQLKGTTLNTNIFIKLIRHFGGEVESISNIAYDNFMMEGLLKRKDESTGNNFFPIKFGIDIEKNPTGVDSIADQAQNLPDDLVNLVIPTGRGITAGGILRGIKKYNKKIKKIWVVHVSAMDRREKINEIAPGISYEYPDFKKYLNKHGQRVRFSIAKNFDLKGNILRQLYPN